MHVVHCMCLSCSLLIDHKACSFNQLISHNHCCLCLSKREHLCETHDTKPDNTMLHAAYTYFKQHESTLWSSSAFFWEMNMQKTSSCAHHLVHCIDKRLTCDTLTSIWQSVRVSEITYFETSIDSAFELISGFRRERCQQGMNVGLFSHELHRSIYR